MFVGREAELQDLMSLWRKRTSSIVACRGRRRIGKSTLFREFARRSADVYMEFEGLAPNPEKPVTNADQLNEFATRLAKLTNSPILHLQNWQDAFFWLDRAVDDEKKTVILLDEISWMAADDPQFPAVLRNAWESFFHRHEKLILVVCVRGTRKAVRSTFLCRHRRRRMSSRSSGDSGSARRLRMRLPSGCGGCRCERA